MLIVANLNPCGLDALGTTKKLIGSDEWNPGHRAINNIQRRNGSWSIERLASQINHGRSSSTVEHGGQWPETDENHVFHLGQRVVRLTRNRSWHTHCHSNNRRAFCTAWRTWWCMDVWRRRRISVRVRNLRWSGVRQMMTSGGHTREKARDELRSRWWSTILCPSTTAIRTRPDTPAAAVAATRSVAVRRGVDNENSNKTSLALPTDG